MSEKTPTTTSSALQAELSTLRAELRSDKSTIRILSNALGSLIFLALVFLALNFGLTAPEDRWLLPVPKAEEGSQCLWFLNQAENVCAVWNIYTTTNRGPQEVDTEGFEEACVKIGKTVYHGSSRAGGVWANTWACEV